MRDAALEILEFLGHGFVFGAQFRGGFVHEVDGLVGEEPVADVAVREDGGGDERGVLDADAVVDLVLFAEAAQDGDGVLDAGLVDHDGLEAALEGGVLLDVLAIFVERGRADAVEFAAREHGLEHVAGVHGSLGLARADHGVDFIDEEDDLAGGLGDFLEHGLEAFLEFTAELGAGDERGEIERDDFLVLERVRHVAADDALREALDDGGLADARFADEDRIVLRAAGKDLDGAADFGIAADNGIELVLAREFGEVAAIFLERFVSRLGILAGDALVAAHFLHGGEERAARDGEAAEDARNFGLLLLVEHGEDEVLDGDVVVLELLRLVLRADEELVEPVGDAVLGCPGTADLGDVIERSLRLGHEKIERDFEPLEEAGNKPVFLSKESVEKMFDIDGLIAEAGGFVLSSAEGGGGPFGKFV